MHTVTRIGQLLHEEHHRALAVLEGLETLVEDHPDERPPPADATLHQRIDEVMAMLATDVERHFEFEEIFLFPVVQEGGADELVALLGAQHAELRPLARHLRRLGQTVRREGMEPDLWPFFRRLSFELAERLVLHIQIEEVSLLSMIDSLVGPELDAELVRLHASAAVPGQPATEFPST